MSNFEPVNFPNISSKRRSFVLTPATEHRGQVLEYFNDYRGNGAPPFDFGSLGDTYIDTEALILYARCPNEWRTWPGPSPSKRLAHPRHDTIFLWCTAKNRVSWLLKSSIKKITRSASEVIARIIAAEAFEISTESKTKQTSGSASEVVPQIVVAGASTTSASFKRKISHNDDNPAKKAKSESADTPTPIVALKRKASPDDASHTNPDKAESGDAPTPNVPAALAWVRCKATAQSSSSPHSHPRSVGTNAAPTTRAASPPTLIPIPALAAIGACTFARPVDHPMGPTQQPPQVAKTTPIVANFMHAMRLHGVGRSFSNVNPSAAEAPIVPPATAPRLDSARVDVQSSSPLPRASSEISTGIPPQSPTTSPPPTPPVLRLPSAPAALVVTADRCLDSPSVLTERRRPSGADLGAPPRTSPETPQGTHASVSSIMSAHEASITKHTAVLTHEIETLKRAGHALLWERHALVTERDALMAERNALVAERDVASVARVNATITALKTQNGALKNRNAELEQQKYFLAHERDVLAEARATLTREKDAVITERTALVISNITLKTQNGALKNRTEELARQKSVLASERDALLVERHAVVSGTQNAALKTRNDELVQQKNHLARERDELQRQRYGLVRELESLKMDQDKLARDAESFMLLSKAHKADHQALSQKNNGLERVNAIFTMDNESLTARTESLSATNALTAQNQSLTVQDKHSKHTVSALQPSLDSLKTKNELRRQHERESSVLEVNDIVRVAGFELSSLTGIADYCKGRAARY
ncbi:hypothetical protein B0H17DRAFT_465695 [Mycena rosella]|uniref:Uncharacterized protein n=1 Tax=Mycena rosella TaxID=1033263 RepID=A0AAD7DMP9_MYCRO|nr:hypothetical protein B0H17DRAFT_465695 [Mycena rosella]